MLVLIYEVYRFIVIVVIVVFVVKQYRIPILDTFKKRNEIVAFGYKDFRDVATAKAKITENVVSEIPQIYSIFFD